jgi:hypothetical protein
VNWDQKRLLVHLLNRYVEAKIQESWKGAKHPDEFPEIDREVAKSKELLMQHLDIISRKKTSRR